MSERLSDGALARLEWHARSMHGERAGGKAGVLMSIDALEAASIVAELRARRAADAATNSVPTSSTLVVLTDGDRESLTWLLGQVEAWIPREYERRADALAALARVLDAHHATEHGEG